MRCVAPAVCAFSSTSDRRLKCCSMGLWHPLSSSSSLHSTSDRVSPSAVSDSSVKCCFLPLSKKAPTALSSSAAGKAKKMSLKWDAMLTAWTLVAMYRQASYQQPRPLRQHRVWAWAPWLLLFASSLGVEALLLKDPRPHYPPVSI